MTDNTVSNQRTVPDRGKCWQSRIAGWASYEMRVLWERIVFAVHALFTMWEEVHRKGRFGYFGFHYRGSIGAYRNRLADYLTLEPGGAKQVLILKVGSSSQYRGRIVSRDNRGKKSWRVET